MPVIPVIDLFAGPGGLGEGFSAFECGGQRPFRIGVSVEKDRTAHRTLSLRCFYRQFHPKSVPDEYYEHLRGNITMEELFQKYPMQARAVKREALRNELGKPNQDRVVDKHIFRILDNPPDRPWVLIGGPPCQAYSTVGRSRMQSKDPEGFKQDKRHFLYQEYLRIIRKFRPHVFVMENVTGILSSKVNGKRIIRQILKDLQNPSKAINGRVCADDEPHEYRIYSLVVPTDDCTDLQPSDFVIKCEDYGIPQARHRVIILGVRSDVTGQPNTLIKHKCQVSVNDVISDMPKLRSTLSKEPDSLDNWRQAIRTVESEPWLGELEPAELKKSIISALADLDGAQGYGGEFVTCRPKPKVHSEWYVDRKLKGVCNHITRGHLGSDLHRYLFAACYAQINDFSPRMRHFPEALYPEHKNVAQAVAGKMFPDRFRVQLKDAPATTVTSHISKDGHYFIHYDPCQCRSLTVREAARLQTFPDNYFFEGGRTPQYKQVGNAVPPLLAKQIAAVVYGVLCQEKSVLEDDGQIKSRKEKLEHVTDPIQEHPAGDGGTITAAQDGLPVSPAFHEVAGKT